MRVSERDLEFRTSLEYGDMFFRFAFAFCFLPFALFLYICIIFGLFSFFCCDFFCLVRGDL